MWSFCAKWVCLHFGDSDPRIFAHHCGPFLQITADSLSPTLPVPRLLCCGGIKYLVMSVFFSTQPCSGMPVPVSGCLGVVPPCGVARDATDATLRCLVLKGPLPANFQGTSSQAHQLTMSLKINKLLLL